MKYKIVSEDGVNSLVEVSTNRTLFNDSERDLNINDKVALRNMNMILEWYTDSVMYDCLSETRVDNWEGHSDARKLFTERMKKC